MHPVTREAGRADAVRAELAARLSAFNEAAVGALHKRAVVLTIRDAAGALIGGLAGEIFWNSLDIESLWSQRTIGGKATAALPARAEEIAGAEGCDSVCLSTFTFQAPAVYGRRGYTVIGTLRHVPPGYSREWFCKRMGS